GQYCTEGAAEGAGSAVQFCGRAGAGYLPPPAAPAGKGAEEHARLPRFEVRPAAQDGGRRGPDRRNRARRGSLVPPSMPWASAIATWAVLAARKFDPRTEDRL